MKLQLVIEIDKLPLHARNICWDKDYVSEKGGLVSPNKCFRSLIFSNFASISVFVCLFFFFGEWNHKVELMHYNNYYWWSTSCKKPHLQMLWMPNPPLIFLDKFKFIIIKPSSFLLYEWMEFECTVQNHSIQLIG